MKVRWAALFACGLLVTTTRASAAVPEPAASALADGQFTRAIKLLTSDNGDPEAKLLRAAASLELQEFGRAREALVGLEVRLPFLSDLIWLLRGEALFGLERYRHAARAFGRAARVRNSRFVDRGRERRADALARAHRYRSAITAYRALLKSFPGHPRRPQIELALARAREGGRARRAAAAHYLEIWLRWPGTPAAAAAAKAIARLRARHVRMRRPGPDALFERARRLRRAKRYELALAQLAEIRAKFPKQAAKADYYTGYTLYKQGRIAEALAALDRMLAGGGDGGWHRRARSRRKDCLALLGRVDEAVHADRAALARPAKTRAGRLRRRAAMVRLAKRLADHGRYREALPLYKKLVKIYRHSRFYRRELAWIAYRAGEYDLAIELLGRYQRPPFSLYWQARAHAKAGRHDRALKLYRRVVERHLRTYYGMLARTRLVELGELELRSVSCSDPNPGPRAPRPGAVALLLDELSARYGRLLPGLLRTRTLWRIGMRREARRELRLVAIDYGWFRYRGKRRAFRIREHPLRVWRGGPKPRRRRRWRLWMSKRGRKIRAATPELGFELSRAMRATGLGYFAWRLAPRDPNRARSAYPRAFGPLVVRLAHRYDLEPNLLWAIMRTESAYRPDAISRVNAGGLMQLMPVTARRLAGELGLEGFKPANVFEPETNLLLAGKYLQAVRRKFRGQLTLVAAAYNGGPHNVARWLTMRGDACQKDEFIEEIPYRESRRYAKKIIRLLSLYERIYCGKDDRLVSNVLDVRYSPYPNY